MTTITKTTKITTVTKIRKKKAQEGKPASFVTFLLDRSGSMRMCWDATIEAFNGYTDGLKAEKDAAIDFTFLQFDSEGIDYIYTGTPIADVKPLSHETYVPRGGTPLIEAAMKTIRAIETKLATRTDNPKVVVNIQTDGEENASARQYSWVELSGLVKAKTESGWQFNFMGAGIDGYNQAAKMGIGAAQTMSYDHTDLRATRAAFTASASNTANFSAGRASNTAYSAAQRMHAGDKFGVARGVGGIIKPSCPIGKPKTGTLPDVSI